MVRAPSGHRPFLPRLSWMAPVPESQLSCEVPAPHRPHMSVGGNLGLFFFFIWEVSFTSALGWSLDGMMSEDVSSF